MLKYLLATIFLCSIVLGFSPAQAGISISADNDNLKWQISTDLITIGNHDNDDDDDDDDD